MTSVFDPLNLILLAVAVVIFWKLKSVLGQRTGFERPPAEPMPQRAERRSNPDNVIPLPNRDTEPQAKGPATPVWTGYATEGSATALGLEAIAKASASDFDPGRFLDGAKSAYEMVLEAFAAGDKQALKPLLARDVLDSFQQAIDARTKAGNKAVFQFVEVKSAEIAAARLDGKRGQVTVRFRSDMINGILDPQGVVIEGDPKAIQEITDVWTFEKDVSSRDPNWKLAATDGEQS